MAVLAATKLFFSRSRRDIVFTSFDTAAMTLSTVYSIDDGWSVALRALGICALSSRPIIVYSVAFFSRFVAWVAVVSPPIARDLLPKPMGDGL